MKHRLLRPLLSALLAACCLSSPAAAQAPSSPFTRSAGETDNRPPVPPGIPTTDANVHLPTESEVKLGREVSAKVEKEYKIVTSGPYHERLQRVARDIVRAIERPEIIAEYKRLYKLPRKDDRSLRVPFEYSFKVVDTTKEVNAFSLPGGAIYVTRGLMDYAVSDHELAAVLAHECAHAAYHHVEQSQRKEKKLNTARLLTLLASVVLGVAGGGAAFGAAGNVVMASQFVSIAIMTGYSKEMEGEADRIAVMALQGTGYNPVGMLTFMHKLARDDRLRGNIDYGVFQTHPYSNERINDIRKELEKRGYRVDTGFLRQISRSFRVEAVPQRLNGRNVAELRLNDNLLLVIAAEEDGLSPLERGRRIARQMEALFADNVTFDDVRQSPDKSMLLLKGVPVIKIYSEDATVAGSPAAATDRAYKEIIRALWQEKLDLQQ